jgi:hypothetical protein
MEQQVTFEKPIRGIDNKQQWKKSHPAGNESLDSTISTSRDLKEIPFELFAKSNGQEIHFTGTTPDSKRFEEAIIKDVKIGTDNFKLYPPLKVDFNSDGFLKSESSYKLKKLVTEKPIADAGLMDSLIGGSQTRLIPAIKEPLSFIEIAQTSLMEIAQNTIGYKPGNTPMIINKIKQR